MAQIKIIHFSDGQYRAEWTVKLMKNYGNQTFYGFGKTKKASMQNLRKEMNKYVNGMDSAMRKVLAAMQEANSMRHHPKIEEYR